MSETETENKDYVTLKIPKKKLTQILCDLSEASMRVDEAIEDLEKAREKTK